MAVGDHLHYEVLIQGISVTPVEWWDGKWIRDHIGRPLMEANVPLPESEYPADKAARAASERPPHTPRSEGPLGPADPTVAAAHEVSR